MKSLVPEPVILPLAHVRMPLFDLHGYSGACSVATLRLLVSGSVVFEASSHLRSNDSFDWWLDGSTCLCRTWRRRSLQGRSFVLNI